MFRQITPTPVVWLRRTPPTGLLRPHFGISEIQPPANHLTADYGKPLVPDAQRDLNSRSPSAGSGVRAFLSGL